MNADQIPNNLGATLMIVAALLLLPLGVGFPLLILALSRVRASDGSPAFPRLRLGCRGLGLPRQMFQKTASSQQSAAVNIELSR